MRIVVALGGNALMQRGESADARNQIDNVKKAAGALAKVAAEHELIITHGNGPQVGVLALESANDERLSEPYPFDTLGAETQGMIGYWIQQAMFNELGGRQVATVVTQTLVNAQDPAFENPTKFVGEMYTEEQAKALASERGWSVKADGSGYRRVVPSPQPEGLVEADLIRTLVDGGTVVICAGGGGIPVVRTEDGKLTGIEAVIDKDLTASVMSEFLGADMFLILTDVPAVMTDYGTENQKEILRATPEELRGMGLPAGSMGPKVEAVSRFVEKTGKAAAIGRLDDALEILAGSKGTIITTSGEFSGL